MLCRLERLERLERPSTPHTLSCIHTRYPHPLSSPLSSPPALTPPALPSPPVSSPAILTRYPHPSALTHCCWSSRSRVLRPPASILTAILTPDPDTTAAGRPSPPLSSPLSSPVSSRLSSPPGPHTTAAGRRAVVSSVPASILTGILTPILTPWPSPPHRCWSSRRRVIRPRLCPYRYPHRYPPLSSPLSSSPVPHHQCWSSRRRVASPLSHPYPHPLALTTGAGRRAVVSFVPASIRTAVLTPILTSSPPVPHHQCWSSRRRVIRPRLYPHRYPHPYPHPLALTTGAARRVVSFVPASILTGILTAILTPRPSHHQCWSPSCRRVIRPRLYPHRYPHHHPHRCPHPPALTTSARHRAARVPKMHLVVASRSGRVSPVPPQSAATTRAVLHACSSSSRRASSGSHLASCTRVRRSKRPGKTHRDKYHESLRDVGGLYLAGSGQRQQ